MRPLTDHVPKCMVELLGKPMLGHQFETLSQCGAEDISLITGYAAASLADWGTRRFHNADFATTNMVASLFTARELFDGSSDLIVAYSDIVYEPRVLQALIAAPGPLATVIDRNWQKLWSARMEDPLADAETLRLNPDGTLREIGLKPQSLADIEGQYIGLSKISADIQRDVVAHYDRLADSVENFNQMFMTSFLTSLIEAGLPIHAAITDSGWLEVDTVEDLSNYQTMQQNGELAQLWQPLSSGQAL